MIALLFVAGGILSFLAVGFFISAPAYRGPRTDHFDGKKFINPTGIQAKGFPDVLKWMTSRKRGAWTTRHWIPLGDKPASRVDRGVRLTFVNHSTFLVQVDGLNILTDPVWSLRVSPFTFAGPRRRRPPGIRLEDLPTIDVVLLSHNHYDHLDMATVRAINSTHSPKFIVPLGVARYLDLHGVDHLHELDWWNGIEIGAGLRADAVPAQHFSGRGMFDRDATLWCGYVIGRKEGKIYFAGDTGYNNETFRAIGNKYSPIHLAIIPIGAYKPQWFMSPIHCSPREALLIHRDVNAVQSIASHFGTFPLADDGEGDPAAELKQVMIDSRLEPGKFRILDEGKAYDFL